MEFVVLVGFFPPVVEIWRSNPGSKGVNPDILKGWEVTVSSPHAAYSFQVVHKILLFVAHRVEFGQDPWFLPFNQQAMETLIALTQSPFLQRCWTPRAHSLSFHLAVKKRSQLLFLTYMERAKSVWDELSGYSLPKLSLSSGWQRSKYE